MRGDVQKKIQQRYLELPPEIQDMITDEKTRAYILDLGKRHGVHVDQLDVLENELLIIMLGLDTPANLPDHLAARAHIPKETAREITHELDQRLLTPLRRAYQKLFHLDERRAAGEEDPRLHGTDLENTPLGNLETDLPDSVFSGDRAHPRTAKPAAESTHPHATEAPHAPTGTTPQEERLAKEGGLRPSERSRDEVRQKLPPRPAPGEGDHPGNATAPGAPATAPHTPPHASPDASAEPRTASTVANGQASPHVQLAASASSSAPGSTVRTYNEQAPTAHARQGETAEAVPAAEEPKRPSHAYASDPYREPVK